MLPAISRYHVIIKVHQKNINRITGAINIQAICPQPHNPNNFTLWQASTLKQLTLNYTSSSTPLTMHTQLHISNNISQTTRPNQAQHLSLTANKPSSTRATKISQRFNPILAHQPCNLKHAIINVHIQYHAVNDPSKAEIPIQTTLITVLKHKSKYTHCTKQAVNIHTPTALVGQPYLVNYT